MKIYHKQNFLRGILLLLLCGLVLAAGVWKGFTPSLAALALLLLALGGRFLVRSLSKIYTRRDRVEERDERNLLVIRKARSAAFRITEVACGLFGLVDLTACWFLWDTALGPLCLGFCIGVGFVLGVMRLALAATLFSSERNT